MRYVSKSRVAEAHQFKYFCFLGTWRIDRKIPMVRGAKSFWEKLKDWWKGYPIYYFDDGEGIPVVIRAGQFVIRFEEYKTYFLMDAYEFHMLFDEEYFKGPVL